MTTVSFLPKRKVIKQGVWKTLNVIVGVTTILNISLAGVWFGPKVANAAPAANPAVNLDQCRNGGAGSPNDCLDLGGGTGWVNGNAGSSQAHYVEGFSIPYRLLMTNLTAGTPIELTLGYDIKHSDKHAIDYLTSYNRLEPHTPFGHPAETVDPTDGTGMVGAPATYAIPAPSSAGSPVPGQPTNSFNALPAGERAMSLWNGTFDLANGISYASQGDLTANQAETRITIRFTPTGSTALLAWGGHIASRLDWGFSGGEPRSAGGISGSPYHMRTVDWNIGNIGNQDRSLSAGAVIPPGNLIVEKQTVPDGSTQPFAFTGAASGSISDGQQLLATVTPGQYTVTETDPAGLGWDLTGLTCDDTDSTGNVGTRTATFNIASNETVKCTFTNTQRPQTGTLIVIKHVITDNGGSASASDFTMHIKQANVDMVAPFAGDENATGANTFVLPTGTYDVSETSWLLSGQYAQVSIICDGQPVSSITVTKNGQHDCLITNNDQPPSLTLVKNVITDNGGTAVPANWTLTATGPTTISGAGGATSGPSFKAGTYTLSESGGPAGYAAGSWSCSNESEGNQVFVGLGESVTCTITNDDIQPKLTVTKVVVNNDGGTKTVSDFPLFVGSTQVNSGQQNGFNVGAYTVSETSQAGYAGTISGDCNAQGQVSLNPGDVKFCTITNDDQAAHLIVVKHVVNNSGGVKTAGDFTLNITGVTVPSGATFTGSESGVNKIVSPGTYAVTENTVSGYAASFSADCTGTIALGQTKTCTVTNDDVLSTIGLTKTGPATAVPGTNITYTLAWSVSGSNPVTNAIVSDTIPANTSFVSAGCGTTTGTCTINSATSTVTWSLGSRNAGDSGTVTLTVKLASPLANGTVIPNEGVFDTDQNEPVRSSITTIVQSAPSLSITKSNNISTFVNPGQSVIYTVVVSNAASATEIATSVTLTDVLPTGFTFIDGGGSTKSFNLGNLTPGQSVTTSYSVAVDAGQAAGTYTNTATAKGTNTASVSATSAVDVRVPQVLGATAAPSLSLTKSVTPKVTNPGKMVTFTVTIHNGGDADATNVVLTDTLPKGFTFAEDGSRTKTWNLGTLEANHDRVINYDVLVGQSVKAGTYKNLAVVTADGVSPISVSRTVQVKVPAVLGLATTGVSVRDYALFALGLSVLAAGLAWFSRLRRPHDQPSR